MTDTIPDPDRSVENEADPTPLPDPDGETGREGGSDQEGLEGLRDLS